MSPSITVSTGGIIGKGVSSHSSLDTVGGGIVTMRTEIICVVSTVLSKDVQQGVKPMGKDSKIWKRIFGFSAGDTVECLPSFSHRYRGYIVLLSKRDNSRFLVQVTRVYFRDDAPYHRWYESSSEPYPMTFESAQLKYWNTREKMPRKVRGLIKYYKAHHTSW